MSVNPELVGRAFAPTVPYLVGREKVREFARAVFATDPQHVDPAAAQQLGYPDVVAPPTFAMVIQDLTLQQLLAGLEHEHDIAGELALVGTQQPCRAHQRCGVDIVAAGVHEPVPLRRERHAGLLLDR